MVKSISIQYSTGSELKKSAPRYAQSRKENYNAKTRETIKAASSSGKYRIEINASEERPYFKIYFSSLDDLNSFAARFPLAMQ